MISETPREENHVTTEADTGRRSWKPRNAATARGWREAREHSPLELSEGSEPGLKLNFALLDSRTVREKRNSVVLFTQFVIICCSSTKIIQT